MHRPKALLAFPVALLIALRAFAAPAPPACVSVALRLGEFALVTAGESLNGPALEISRPDGSKDHVATGIPGGESASLIAHSDGTWRVCAQRATPAGLRIAVRRPAVPGDEERVTGESILSQAHDLAASAKPRVLRDAAARIDEAIRHWRAAAEPPERIAGALVRRGDALNGAGDFPAALASYQEAITLDDGRNPRVSGEAWANDGVALRRQGNVIEARAAFDRATALFIQASITAPGPPIDIALAAVANDRGLAALDTGDYQQGLDSFLAALRPMSRFAPDLAHSVLLNIALAYRYLGDYARAEAYLRRALAGLRGDAMRQEKARALNNLGRLRALRGDIDGGAAILRQAQSLAGDIPGIGADLRNNLGQIALRRGDAKTALVQLEAARAAYEKLGDIRETASALHFIGTAHAALGQFDAALSSLNAALKLKLDAGLDDSSVNTLIEIARAERASSHPDLARAVLERGIETNEKLRVLVAAPDLRAAWLTPRRQIYTEMIGLLFDRACAPPPDQGAAWVCPSPGTAATTAFNFAERAFARSLGESLARGPQRDAPGPGARQAEILRQVSLRSIQLQRLAERTGAAANRAALTAELDLLELEYQSLEGARPRAISAAFADLDRFRQNQPADSLLLEYWPGQPFSYLWAVTNNEVRWARLPGQTRIARLSEEASTLLRQRTAPLDESAHRRSAVLAELGRLLLSPVAGLLRGRRILIAAGAELGPTPFEALPVPGKAGIPLGVLNPVIRIPSVAALDALRKRPPAAPGSKIVIFADAVFKGDPRSPHPGAGFLARLAFSGEEAASIASAFGSRRVLVKTGFAARKNELTAAPLRASILHLATHAVSSSERPEMSGVWFTELTPSGRAVDAWLSMGEVYNLSLTMDLAVLSACETGVGQTTGDGVLSLARGFLLAGANRVIYSRWKIADEGTAVFMREFYSRLAATGDVALSLQGSRAALRKGVAGTAWSDPFYWAGFAVEGDPTSLGREAIPR